MHARVQFKCQELYIFDVRAWVDCDDVSVLDTEVVSDNTVHTRTPIIKIIISQDDENCVLSLLALHKNCVATEEL